MGENLKGSTIERTAYRLLPKVNNLRERGGGIYVLENIFISLILLQIMEEEFPLDVSWTTGFGKKTTEKSVNLTEFPRMMNLIQGEIYFL